MSVVAVVAVVVVAVAVDTIHINMCNGVCKRIVLVVRVPSASATVSSWVARGHVCCFFCDYYVNVHHFRAGGAQM